MAHDHHHHDDDEELEPEEIQSPSAIFDAEFLGEPVPAGFDAVRVPIDGTLKSNLDWTQASNAAKAYISQGLKIVWDLDLGLFSSLTHPLTHQGQFQSLLLSLEHFRDTLWQQFRKESVGLCIYRGPADLNHGLHLDAASEYLDHLAQRLPDTIPQYILLDATKVDDALQRALLLTKERYFHFTLGVTGARGCGGDLGWNQAPLAMGFIGREVPKVAYEAPVCAICLPPLEAINAKTEPLLRRLFDKVEVPFRVIPESYLTISWDGLDVIYVAEELVTPQGKRMLDGFRAAGGQVK
jgi:hypothetical protein